MSILDYNNIKKIATSQYSFFKDYVGTDREKITSIMRLNNTSVKVAYNITGTIPLDYEVIVRSYNIEGTKILSQKTVYTKKFEFGDSRDVVLDVVGDSNTIAVIFKILDTTISSYGFNNFEVSESLNDYGKQLIEQNSNQTNLLYRYGENTTQPLVFLSRICKIRKDKFWLSFKEYANSTSVKIDLLTAYNDKPTHQQIVTLFDGTKRDGTFTPILLPVVPESKEFRIRITNTTSGATQLSLKTVDIIEVDEFEDSLQYLSIAPKPQFQTLNLESNVASATQSVTNYKYFSFENNSVLSNVYLTLGNLKKKLKPSETFVFKNISGLTSFTHKADAGSASIVFTGANEKIVDNEVGKTTDLTFYNLRGYNVIRPFPMAKNIVWGTKTNDRELWRFDLDNEMNIVSETRLQTFDLPIIDIFVTYNNVMLISTGNMYATSTSDVNFKLYRSDSLNWGVNVTEIAIESKSTWFPRLGIDQVGNGAIIFSEYSTIESSLSVWRSMDQGLTWSAVLTKSNPSDIRHFHTVNVDYTNMNDVYITAGDLLNQLKWFKSTDKGVTFTEMTSLTTSLGESAKILGMDISPTHFVIVTDAPAFMNQIIKIDKATFEFKVKLQTAQVFFGLVRSGRALFAHTLTQHGVNILDKTDYVNELYYSLDDGETWKVGWRWLINQASAGNLGFRYSTLPDRDGNIYLRTDRNGMLGHSLAQNTIRVSLSR